MLVDSGTIGYSYEKPNKTDYKRRENGTFGSGNVANPNGRPKGKTLKEWAREKLMGMTDEEREEFIKTLPKETLWRMAEGNPAQDLTSAGEKIEFKPIYDGISRYNGNEKNIQLEKKDKGS
jgi:hypothetical protein